MPRNPQHQLVQFGIALAAGIIVAYLVPEPYGVGFLAVVLLGALAFHKQAPQQFAAWLASL